MRKSMCRLAALACCTLLGNAHAADDPVAGQTKATEIGCSECHGSQGNGESLRYPSLAGQHAQYLVAAMLAYKHGQRPGGTMPKACADLAEQDMRNMAAHYSLATWQPSVDTDLPGDPDNGRVLSQACATCHGVDGNSLQPQYPKLAGNSAKYLLRAMRAYKRGRRHAPEMQTLLEPLTNSQMGDIASYYAIQERR